MATEDVIHQPELLHSNNKLLDVWTHVNNIKFMLHSKYYKHLRNGTLRTHYDKYDNYHLNMEKSIRTKMKANLYKYRKTGDKNCLKAIKELWQKLYGNCLVKTNRLPDLHILYSRYGLNAKRTPRHIKRENKRPIRKQVQNAV